MPDDAPAGLAERLDDDLKDALRAGDKVRLGALGDDAAVKVLRGLVKQHRESIEQFRVGGRDALVARESEEMALLEAYLPAQMDAAAITAVVTEVIASEGASGPGDLGRVMKAAMARMGGQADGKEVRTIAQRLLEGGS